MSKESVVDAMRYMINAHEKAEGCENCELRDLHRLMRETPVSMWEKILNNKNKRWRAEKDADYWYVNPYGVAIISKEGGSMYDDTLYYSHNYFRTKEEAEKYAKVLETEMLLRKFADENNYKAVDWNNTDERKWCLIYDCKICGIAPCVVFHSRDPRTVYFNSQELAMGAIEEIGNDRLIEYFTYEW